ncbi:hypothetical protein [Nocardia sp. NPDC005998]|uniref:hypothetical protein n=1 Tax=Nocardia sp. NPDC005998 TaxID=3156894 RepID=UPI0033BDF670
MLTQRPAEIRSFDLDAGAIRLEFFAHPRLIRPRIVVEFVEQSPARKTAVQRRGLARRKASPSTPPRCCSAASRGTSPLEAISERTGIPPASMYHYFADRHQVEVELCRAICAIS